MKLNCLNASFHFYLNFFLTLSLSLSLFSLPSKTIELYNFRSIIFRENLFLLNQWIWEFSMIYQELNDMFKDYCLLECTGMGMMMIPIFHGMHSCNLFQWYQTFKDNSTYKHKDNIASKQGDILWRFKTLLQSSKYISSKYHSFISL